LSTSTLPPLLLALMMPVQLLEDLPLVPAVQLSLPLLVQLLPPSLLLLLEDVVSCSRPGGVT
jgi:hypothetical protein